MELRTSLAERITALRQTETWKTYLTVRDWVVRMLREHENQNGRVSDYWEEELSGFDYMLDASPLIIERLREHCYHLTGLRPYEYRKHHAREQGPYHKKLDLLRKADRKGLRVGELPALGGFGYSIDGLLVNKDTLKFYEALIALDKGGVFDRLSAQEDRLAVLEIGAGWGGFACQFKKAFPETTYIVVDLPSTLLFYSVYLKSVCPGSRVFLYGDSSLEALGKSWRNYDFIFLPHYCFTDIVLERLDLAINMVSFQEMRCDEMRRYLEKLVRLDCTTLYSLNRDRSPHNHQMTSVRAIMSEYYRTTEIVVTKYSYEDMPISLFGGLAGDILDAIKSIARRLLRKREFRYRHLLACRSSEGAGSRETRGDRARG